MKVKSITLALLLTLLPVAHARAEEPGSDMRALGIVTTGVGGALLISLFALFIASVSEQLLLPTTCHFNDPNDVSAGSHCDHEMDHDAAIGLGAAAAGALAVGVPLLVVGTVKQHRYRAKIRLFTSQHGGGILLGGSF
jgi:hypothetical protein